MVKFRVFFICDTDRILNYWSERTLTGYIKTYVMLLD